MKWIPEFQDFDSVSEANANLVLTEAEKSLAATVADSECLATNAVYVIGAILALLSACAGLLVNTIKLSEPLAKQDWRLLSVYGVLFAYVAGVGASLLHGAFRSREIDHGGNSPENLVRAEYLSLKPAALVLLEACSYRDRILKNAKRNARTGYAINKAIRWLCVAPLVFVAASAAVLIIGF